MITRPLQLCLLLIVWITQANAAIIVGHRGAAALSPENTLASYETAIRLGVDMIDMDITLTKDGELVVYHDNQLNDAFTRDQTGDWLDSPGAYLHDLNLATLKQFDVGRLNPAHPYEQNFPFQIGQDDVRIPTLRQVIQFAKQIGPPNLKFQIEIKTTPNAPIESPLPIEIVPKLIEVLEEENIIARTEVHSFDWRNLLLLKDLAPDIVTSFLTDEFEPDRVLSAEWTAEQQSQNPNLTIPALIAHLGGEVWCPNHNDITPELIANAHNAGLRVYGWTANEPADIVNLLEMGVDGIISDRPDLALGLRAAFLTATHARTT